MVAGKFYFFQSGQSWHTWPKLGTLSGTAVAVKINLETTKEPGATTSLFPGENYEFKHTKWEEEIIWDAENMERIPEPKVLTLDIEDEPRLFGLPEDRTSDEQNAPTGSSSQSPSAASASVSAASPSKTAYDRKVTSHTAQLNLLHIIMNENTRSCRF